MRLLDKVCLLVFLTSVDCRLKEQHRPCSFNPLCTCSNGGPDLGSVCCHNIPFLTVPSQINNSAIYIMSLNDNKLRFLEDYSLNGTGLWKLQITNNLLTDLPPNALVGLEKTLSVLDLNKNNLIRIPREAIHNLEKLSNLNLAGNQIALLHNEDFRNLGRTLKLLDLSQNGLVHIQNDVFRNMVSLEVLNLAHNSITSIDDITFQGGLNNLKHIILTGNQLQQIPLNALASLKNIRIVNLNENLISTISEGREIRSRIYLDELHLEYNLIKQLTSESFRLFKQVNRIFLKGNPIKIVNDTFLNTNATEIYIPHCSISVITMNAFVSVTESLQILDLSYNNLKEFPSLPLLKLTKLSLAGNSMKEIIPENIKYYGNILKYLDITGFEMNGISHESMKYLPSLRELAFNKHQLVLSSEYLKNIGTSIEKLDLVKCSAQIIESGAFQKLSGLKSLDLSYNAISHIENTTFKDTRHSLNTLIFHGALKMSIFPYKSIALLSKLQYLDASSNRFRHLPYESFASFQDLKFLNLNYNELMDLNLNFINEINNPSIEYIKIAFNKITLLKTYTFRNLQNLIYLQLNDNSITHIGRSTFLDLDSVMNIRLDGNSIQSIDNEAFQNLPNIQSINLAYNKLPSLNLAAFNQVGRLSTLRIDADHNNIQNLTVNYTRSHTSSNIKNIDFSYNNISSIDSHYFDPIRLSVTILDLSHNIISNLTKLSFANMANLQTLVLSSNGIETIHEHEFKGLKALQILNLSKNKLNSLPDELFEDQYKLRIFSATNNKLSDLPDGIFEKTVLEQLDLSFNNYEYFPEHSVLKINGTLQYLNLDGNQIETINFSNIMPLQNLRYLSMSQNKLLLPESATEFQFSKLISLDLSHNYIESLPLWIGNHLPITLETLNLANTSLTAFPIVNAQNILVLNLSSNFIKAVETETLEPFKKLQILDFSNNLLLHTQSVWSNLQQLKTLYLESNPIQKLSNISFSNMQRLQELYLKRMKLKDIHQDAFLELTALKKLEMDIYPTKNTNLSEMLRGNQGIEEVHLHVQENGLEKVFQGLLPKSLKSIVLEGESLKHLDESIFSNVQSKTLMLDIKNTNITKLSQKVFENMKDVKNFTASFINNKLQTIDKMYTMENQVSDKYLTSLKLSGNQLHCNCDLAWIWQWMKEYEYENQCKEMICEEAYLQDLRETTCANMKNKSIIRVFKTEIDCFSGSVPVFFIGTSQILQIITFNVIYTKFFLV